MIRRPRFYMPLLITLLAYVIAFIVPVSSAAPASVGLPPAQVLGSVLRQIPPSVPVWSSNVRANTDTTAYGQHEPSLAVSPVNPNFIVIANKDFREGDVKHVWIEASRDGGLTWPTQFRMTAGIATETESDPVVMARDDGRIYVACLTTGNNGIWITWTDDEGITWHPVVSIVAGQGSLQDKDWMAIDNNPASPYYHRVYMAWAPGGVVVSYSSDGGTTWTTPQQVPNEGRSIEYPYPVVAPNGDVFVFYLSDWGNRNPNPSTIKVVKSTNGGASWGQPVSIATIIQPNTPPRSGDNWRFFSILSATVDPTNNNRLYVGWTDDRNHNTNGMDVMYSASTDHGATWGPITRLSHDPTGVVRDHITPILKAGQDGRLNALWLDRRLDPANHLFQAWYSSSADGGATWEPDSQVSDAPGLGFDLNVGLPASSGNAAGDYWGLDVVGPYIYTAWTDTRNGNQDIYTSRGTRGAVSPTVTPSATLTVLTTTPTSTATSTSTVIATYTRTATAISTATPSSTPTTVAGTPPATATPTASVTGTPCSLTFSDVHPGDYFYEAVRNLSCRGVISGYGDNTFRPYNNVTRAQVCKILVLGEGWTINTTGGPHFTDVTPTYWAYDYIETVYNRNGGGIISGYADGTFRPGNELTRGQLSKVIVLAQQWAINSAGGPHFIDVPTTNPFYAYVETAYAHSIISGYADHTFRPSASITRGQTAKVLYNAFSQPFSKRK